MTKSYWPTVEEEKQLIEDFCERIAGDPSLLHKIVRYYVDDWTRTEYNDYYYQNAEDETKKVCRVPVLTDKGDEWIDIIHDNWDEALQIARERGYTLNVKHLGSSDLGGN